MSKMRISSIKLIEGGLKGMEVKYHKASKKGGIDWDDEHSSKFKAPVPTIIKDKISELYRHVMLICRLVDNAYVKESLQITGITSDADTNFLISAKLKTFDNLTFAVNTPLMKDDTEYKGYGDAIEIVSDIYSGVYQYVEEGIVANNKQIVHDFSKITGESIEIDNMSEEELSLRARDILEKMGGIVMMPDDFEIESNNDISNLENEGIKIPAPEPIVSQV